MNETRIREEICRIGRSLHARGYAHSSAGNISARLEDGFLITPTDACLGFLDPAALAKLDADGNQVSGERASKTIVLHRSIYAKAKDAHGIVHTHSANLVALSLLPDTDPAEILPPMTPYYIMKVGHVPLIPYRRPGAPEVADLVAAHIPRCRAVMLQSLGPVVWDGSVSKAAFALEELEETAKLHMMTRGLNPRRLSQAEVADLKAAFKLEY
jgi:ribulose-5-phosphate 4-epimerase/fuculose-1-phosphate aldolase